LQSISASKEGSLPENTARRQASISQTVQDSLMASALTLTRPSTQFDDTDGHRSGLERSFAVNRRLDTRNRFCEEWAAILNIMHSGCLMVKLERKHMSPMPIIPINACLTKRHKYAAYLHANREKINRQRAAWRKANCEKIRRLQAAWKKANLEKNRKFQIAYYEANREKLLRDKAGYRDANREKTSRRHAAYKKANPSRVAANIKAYKARKRKATIGDITEIAKVYERRNWWRQGFDVVIDHIIPLAKGGSHEAGNLQIIYRSENLRKRDQLDYKPHVIFI
jgi:5-methylcytosine-specific restriction endonuclease McrA